MIGKNDIKMVGDHYAAIQDGRVVAIVLREMTGGWKFKALVEGATGHPEDYMGSLEGALERAGTFEARDRR